MTTPSSTDRTIDENQNHSIQSFDPKVDNEEGLTEPVKQVSSSFRIENETIYINENPIPKNDFQDFVYATGGLAPVYKPNPRREFGNPVAPGLFCFGVLCFTLGLIECGARHVSGPSVLIGSCFFNGGLILIIIGIWSLIIENTWAATVFFGLGGFFSSYGAVLCSAFGIGAAYTTAEDLNNAIGLFLSAYVVFTFLLWVCTFKSTIAMCVLFFFVWFFLLLLDIATFSGSAGVTKAAGVFCFLTAMASFWNAFGVMADNTNSYFTVRPWMMPVAHKPKKHTDVEKQE